MAEDVFEPRSIIITGSRGFIGSNFVRWVAANHPGVHVTMLEKLTYAGNSENIAGLSELQVKLVVGDTCDSELLGRVVLGYDAVVHYAAESINDNSIADPEPFVRTNVGGTYRHLEAYREYEVCYRYNSADEVYGDPALDESRRFERDGPYRSSSPYSSSRVSSDLLVRPRARAYGIRATISNCSDIYGPYQHVEKFIPRQVTNVLCGIRPKLYGTGENVHDWIHAEDHSRAVWDVLTRGRIGEAYLIGVNGDRITSRSCARYSARWVGPRTTSTGCATTPATNAIGTRRSWSASWAGVPPHGLPGRPRVDDRVVPHARVMVAPGQGGQRGQVCGTGTIKVWNSSCEAGHFYER